MYITLDFDLRERILNAKQISIDSILSSKPLKKDYSNGGFYLIIGDENDFYIGKSIDYMYRLKVHSYKSSDKLNIDKKLNDGFDLFNFYLILTYNEIGINFFNRKLETVIEHRLISEAKKIFTKTYNKQHYGHI
jgi:hypothetical protein